MNDPNESTNEDTGTGLTPEDLAAFGNDVLDDMNPDRTSDDDSRERDDSGRFVAKDHKDPKSTATSQDPADKPLEPTARTPVVPPAVDATAPQVAVPSAPGAPPPGPSGPDLTRAPTSWKPEHHTAFAALTPELRAEIHRREEDFHKGIESYKTKSGFADAMIGAIQPFYPSLQASGIDPVAHARNLMGFHHRMATGDKPVRVDMIRRLAGDFGLSVNDFVAPGAPGDPLDAPVVDPAVQALREELGRVTPALRNLEAERAAEKQARVTESVTTFAKDKPYFDEVANDIAKFIQSGVYPDLASAYQAAIWANPTVREKVRTDEQRRIDAERVAADKAESDRKAASAAAKGSTLRTGPKVVNGTGKPAGTMEQTMRDKLDELMPD